MNGNFWKGFGLCFLGLVLWVVFSFGAVFSPGEYGPHVLMMLSFTLMVFGPVLFWIVFPLKERWYDKGEHARFYAVMIPIGLIFLICLGAAFLPPEVPKPSGTTGVPEEPTEVPEKPTEVPEEPTEVPEVPVINSVTTEVADHGGWASMKVTVEGEEDSFDLTLSDPEKNTVGRGHITSSDMSDGRETVWLWMADYHAQGKSGTYTLVIEEWMGDKVYENEFTYSGPDLKIEWGSPEFRSVGWLGYDLENLSVTISNDGDLPAYVSDMKVIIAGKEATGLLSTVHTAVIPAGETTTLKGKFCGLNAIKEGSYHATYELETVVVQGFVTLATHSALVQVPGE